MQNAETLINIEAGGLGLFSSISASQKSERAWIAQAIPALRWALRAVPFQGTSHRYSFPHFLSGLTARAGGSNRRQLWSALMRNIPGSVIVRLQAVREDVEMTTTPEKAEQRIILRDVSWSTYQDLLKDCEDRSSPRLTYDRGVLVKIDGKIGQDKDGRGFYG